MYPNLWLSMVIYVFLFNRSRYAANSNNAPLQGGNPSKLPYTICIMSYPLKNVWHLMIPALVHHHQYHHNHHQHQHQHYFQQGQHRAPTVHQHQPADHLAVTVIVTISMTVTVSTAIIFSPCVDTSLTSWQRHRSLL